MENPKEKCITSLKQFLKSPISATNVIFLELCSGVEALMKNIFELTKEKEFSSGSITNRNSIIINCSQMISCLEFISNIVREEHLVNVILEESRRVAINRIKFCLDMIEEVPLKNDVAVNDFGRFLKWMDIALDNIAKIDIDIGKQYLLAEFKETRSTYENILAHAMSIAQICLDEDGKVIHGSCRTVLDILQDLENELNKKEPNKAMVSLFIDDASNKLCSLERKVDIAVLRLSLRVFSKYCFPLEKLHNFCENYSNDLCVQDEELDNIIASFDLHVDRIFQIGLFAVFCSSNMKSGINIRNCMASLEFLETELVPLMKTMKNSSEIHRVSALIFKNYWIREANKLKNLVYEIIDPSAFSEVIYNEIALEIDRILEIYIQNKRFTKHIFENIVDIAKVLVEFLLTVVRIEAIIDEKVKDRIRKCHLITSEIGTAIDLLDDHNIVTNDRLLKRCKILQTEVKKLLLLLKYDNKVSSAAINERMESAEKENMNDMFFSRIICRGKEILENRSIMYRTPKKCYNTFENCDDGSPKSMESFIMKKLANPKINFSFRSSDENSSSSIHIRDIFMSLTELTSSVTGQ